MVSTDTEYLHYIKVTQYISYLTLILTTNFSLFKLCQVIYSKFVLLSGLIRMLFPFKMKAFPRKVNKICY